MKKPPSSEETVARRGTTKKTIIGLKDKILMLLNKLASISYRVLWLSLLMLFASVNSQAAPESELIKFWLNHNPESKQTIDHHPWQQLLDKYLISNHPSGVHRFQYAKVSPADKKLLNQYLTSLQALDPRQYRRAEQKAYWINLYNALTVQLILREYPVSSITKLGEGLFSFGPWDDEAAQIQSQALTLNHIEHGILRPIYQDNRIHYAVNCASIGCPNLAPQAFTAENTEALMEQAAIEYINHPRGVQVKGKDILASSIFDWYLVDFGNNRENLIKHWLQYAKPALASQLKNADGDLDFDYDWQLNQP